MTKTQPVGASFDIVISSDALFYLFFDEPCLDDENIVEAKELSDKWPNGLHLIEYELVPDDYRAVATVAPLLPAKKHSGPAKRLNAGPPRNIIHLPTDTFKPSHVLYFGKEAAWEILLSDLVYWRTAVYQGSMWVFSDVQEAEIKTTPQGLRYFQYGETTKKPGTVLYLRDFGKAI